MFNALIKQDYIEINPNNNLNFDKVMTNYFNRAEETEIRFEKDLSQFTASEIIAMYKSFCTASLEMLIVINNQFFNYTNWYMKNIENRDNQNHYREMRSDILLNCVSYAGFKSNIITRSQLLSLIKDFANPYEQFLYLALFEGIKGEQMSDFFNLKVSDFIKSKKMLQLSNRVIPVSVELIHYAEEAANEYQIYNISGDPVSRGELLESDDRILKCPKEVGFEADNEERTRLVYRIMRKSKRYDFVPKTLSSTSLIESGRIHWISEYMRKKEISAEQVLRDYKAEMENIYGSIPSIPKWLMKYEIYCK